VPARLRAAKKSSPHAANSAGFHYCCGVYHRCAHDPAKAVRAFNLARRDGEWGFNAVSSMVEIYLGVGVGGTLSDLVLAAEGGGVAPSVFESISVAEALMQEPVMLSKQSTPGYRILAAFVAICRGERSRALETATRDVMQLYTEDKTNVAALLAACCGLLVNKSEGKAKNNLKRIYKMPYNEVRHARCPVRPSCVGAPPHRPLHSLTARRSPLTARSPTVVPRVLRAGVAPARGDLHEGGEAIECAGAVPEVRAVQSIVLEGVRAPRRDQRALAGVPRRGGGVPAGV
jgi:hypothetical protein